MIAKREIWKYQKEGKVWVGKYRNSQNLIHWHSDCELLYVEKGDIDVFCNGKSYYLTQGETLFVASGQMHYMHARTRDTILIVIIFDNSIIRPYFGQTRLLCPKLKESYPVPELYASLFRVLTEKEAFFGAEAAREMLGFMLDVFRKERMVMLENAKEDVSLQNLLEEVHKHYDYYTFPDAVAFMNMSEAYFSRYFKKITGITFTQYLNYVRVDNAIHLLRKGKETVTEIAAKCGFGTIRNFNRVFLKLTGYPPKRLPPDFELDEQFFYLSDISFNPTIHDCELIESGE